MRRLRWVRVVGCAAILVGPALASCEREERRFRELPPMASRAQPVRLSTLQPGSPLAARVAGSPYENNSYGINEGKRLYEWYNCAGCHFHGGGGIGPPLMDELWIYGGSPQNIYDTVVEGRPNGMPSYGGHIPDGQLWKIVAYVRSLSGQVSKPAAPTRSDELMAHPSEQAMEKQKPKPQKASHPG